jgi:acetyl-CoA C-acetyltransferase
MTADRRPIIVGVGEASERIGSPDYQALSPVELAANAARAAMADTGGTAIAAAIDVIACIRQFEVSGPHASPPFGASNNFSRSVGNRIGASPARAIVEVIGGQGPQHLINEFAQAIGKGEMGMALLVGSEAISTVRNLQVKGESRDWHETVEGQLEDRGFGLEGLLTPDIATHGIRSAVQAYAVFENARRAKTGKNRSDYAVEMAGLFAPFTKVAATNAHAMAPEVLSVDDIAKVTDRNRLISDPFPRRVVARDQANQGAAVLLTSVDKARALGIPEDRWVYLHGGADAKERNIVERQDLAASPASVAAVKQALSVAGKTFDDIDVIDLYSCFPIAVFNITDAFGLATDGTRQLTRTGGLPFFGGAGNNYSMHAIAAVIQGLRAKPGAFGLVAANGGFLSKYSVGVYSTAPCQWTGFDSKALQSEIDSWAAPTIEPSPVGEGVIESYTIDYSAKVPRATVFARNASGARFVAMAASENDDITPVMITSEPLGATVTVTQDDKGRAILTGFVPRA